MFELHWGLTVDFGAAQYLKYLLTRGSIIVSNLLSSTTTHNVLPTPLKYCASTNEMFRVTGYGGSDTTTKKSKKSYHVTRRCANRICDQRKGHNILFWM